MKESKMPDKAFAISLLLMLVAGSLPAQLYTHDNVQERPSYGTRTVNALHKLSVSVQDHTDATCNIRSVSVGHVLLPGISYQPMHVVVIRGWCNFQQWHGENTGWPFMTITATVNGHSKTIPFWYGFQIFTPYIDGEGRQRLDTRNDYKWSILVACLPSEQIKGSIVFKQRNSWIYDSAEFDLRATTLVLRSPDQPLVVPRQPPGTGNNKFKFMTPEQAKKWKLRNGFKD